LLLTSIKMSLSDTDTTIVADLASAGQLITSLTSNLASLQALMGNVATTVMDPGTAVAGTMPCFLDTQPEAFSRNVQKLQSMPMFTTATTAVCNTAGLAANDPRRAQVQTAMLTSTVAIALTYARGAVQQYQARYNEKIQETADMVLTSMNVDGDAMTKKIQSVTTMWDTIHTSTTSGRVEHTRRMDDIKATYQKDMKELDRLFAEKEKLNGLLMRQNATVQEKISGANGIDELTQEDVQKSGLVERMVRSCVKSVDSQIYPTSTEGGKTVLSKTKLVVPVQLASQRRGSKLQINAEAWMKASKGAYVCTKPAFMRAGRQICPVTRTFWKPPSKADRYKDVPEACRQKYTEESEEIWGELAPQVEAESLLACTTPFYYGPNDEFKGQVMEGDGVSLYWALLTFFRPLDDAYQEDVEEWLDECYKLFQKYDGTIIYNLQTIKAKVAEAQIMGTRIKWFKTGKKWISALEGRPIFAVALEKYKKMKINTDDCVVVLNDICRDILAKAKEELMSKSANISIPFVHGAHMAENDWPENLFADPGEASAMSAVVDEMQDAGIDVNLLQGAITGFDRDINPALMEAMMAFRNRGKGQGKGGGRRFQPQERLGRRTEMIAKLEQGRTAGSGGQGSQFRQQNQLRGMIGAMMANGKSMQKHKVCFGKDCPAEKFKNYEFCSTCFRQGCGSGSITAKDGNKYCIVAFSESDPAAKENRMKNNEIIRAGANKWRTGHAYNVDVAPRMVEDEQEMEQAAREYAMSTWSDIVSGAKRGRRDSEDDGRGDEKRVDTGVEAELAYDVADTEDKHTREAMMAQLEKTMALARQ
jgi:hypothetical protein